MMMTNFVGFFVLILVFSTLFGFGCLLTMLIINLYFVMILLLLLLVKNKLKRFEELNKNG